MPPTLFPVPFSPYAADLHQEILAVQDSTDLGANFQQQWDHFVGSGQAWALLIGLVVGYVLRMFTSYG
jgi:hypothetical protein